MRTRPPSQSSAEILGQPKLELRKAVQLSPNDPALLTSLGGVLGMRGNLKQANLYLAQAVKLKPQDPLLLRNLAANEWQLGRFHEAHIHLESVLRSNGGDKAAIFLLGMVTENEKDYARSIALLESVPEVIRSAAGGAGSACQLVLSHQSPWRRGSGFAKAGWPIGAASDHFAGWASGHGRSRLCDRGRFACVDSKQALRPGRCIRVAGSGAVSRRASRGVREDTRRSAGYRPCQSRRIFAAVQGIGGPGRLPRALGSSRQSRTVISGFARSTDRKGCNGDEAAIIFPPQP